MPFWIIQLDQLTTGGLQLWGCGWSLFKSTLLKHHSTLRMAGGWNVFCCSHPGFCKESVLKRPVLCRMCLRWQRLADTRRWLSWITASFARCADRGRPEMLCVLLHVIFDRQRRVMMKGPELSSTQRHNGEKLPYVMLGWPALITLESHRLEL